MILVFLAGWSCSIAYASHLTAQGDRLKLAIGMYAVAAGFSLSSLFVTLDLHHWTASNGDQVAAVAREVGKFILVFSGLPAGIGAISSKAAPRTRIALAAYGLAVLASIPSISAL